MSQNNAWVRFRSVAYLRGKGIHYGVTNEAILPRNAKAPGVYCVGVSPAQRSLCDVCDVDVEGLADGHYDYAFVGRMLEQAPSQYVLMGNIAAKLKVGGHLIIHQALTSFTPEKIHKIVKDTGTWREKATYKQEGQALHIYKKLSSKGCKIEPPSPKPTKPRACVCRYGAIGDMIMLTPLVKRLHEDGYHVTVNCSPYSAPVLDNNPYVDNIILQERDAVPNPQLGEYWKLWEPEYEKYINLSESVEGSLLVVEGRPEFFTTQAYRQRRSGDVNYWDRTMELGGYKDVETPRGELYFTHQEEKWGKDLRKHFKGKFIVVWALRGSSEHKVYPLLQPVLTDWLAKHPDVQVVTTGGPESKPLEFEHPQVLNTAGEWSLRETMALVKHADLVVGPETGMLNAASCWPTVGKIVFLSHSNHKNLCAHWGENHTCLTPDVKCFPCYQLHYSLASCPISSIIDETTNDVVARGPVCAMGGISGERVITALETHYEKFEQAH